MYIIPDIMLQFDYIFKFTKTPMVKDECMDIGVEIRTRDWLKNEHNFILRVKMC